MKDYPNHLSRFDPISRLFAMRAQRHFAKRLGKEERVQSLAQGRGQSGQEVWAVTELQVVILRLGIFSRDFRSIPRKEIASCTLHAKRLFSEIHLQATDGEECLKHVCQASAEHFVHNTNGIVP